VTPAPSAAASRRTRSENLERVRAALGSRDPARIDAEPLELFLEITTHCDLRCPRCPRETDEEILSGRTVAHLDAGRLDRLEGAMLAAFALHACGLGEPVLHRGLPEIARKAREAGHALAIRTNGVRLGPERAAALADAGVGEIHVSIDGGTPASFARDRAPADPERVHSNLAALVALGRVPVVVHTVVSEETLSELPSLVDALSLADVKRLTAAPRVGGRAPSLDFAAARVRARERGIEFSVLEEPREGPGAREPAGPGLLGDLPATSRVDAPPAGGAVLRALCARPFGAAYVSAGGRVGPCENGLHALGSLAAGTVKDAFAGRAFEALRRKMLDGVVPPECRACVRLGRRATSAPGIAFEPIEPRLFELSAAGEPRVRRAAELSIEVSPILRKKGSRAVPVDAYVRLRADRARRVRVALEWRAGGEREWLSPPRLEEIPAYFGHDVHIDAEVPAALDGRGGGLFLRFLVEDAATGGVLVDETHPVRTREGTPPARPRS